ncbi:hypothetical protein GCM10009813_26570 [Brevibacterium marinum]
MSLVDPRRCRAPSQTARTVPPASAHPSLRPPHPNPAATRDKETALDTEAALDRGTAMDPMYSRPRCSRLVLNLLWMRDRDSLATGRRPAAPRPTRIHSAAHLLRAPVKVPVRALVRVLVKVPVRAPAQLSDTWAIRRIRVGFPRPAPQASNPRRTVPATLPVRVPKLVRAALPLRVAPAAPVPQLVRAFPMASMAPTAKVARTPPVGKTVRVVQVLPTGPAAQAIPMLPTAPVAQAIRTDLTGPVARGRTGAKHRLGGRSEDQGGVPPSPSP